jgi:opacity protein-like surface antigen
MYNIKFKDDDTETVINIPLRIGYFIYKGLELEPEIIVTIPEESEDTGYFLFVNLAYNFRTSGQFMPFILAGGGYGNSSPIYNVAPDMDMGITALNFGGGIKYLIGNSAAIRIEYRFTKYSGEKTETSWWGSYTEEVDRKDNNIMVGISIFF